MLISLSLLLIMSLVLLVAARKMAVRQLVMKANGVNSLQEIPLFGKRRQLAERNTPVTIRNLQNS